MMKMTKKEYNDFVKAKQKKSPTIKNCIYAFLFGGAICTVGQVFLNIYEASGLDKEDSSGAVSITMICIGALLTGLDIYDNLAKYGGAGTLVPITGFANSIVAPAIEYKSEGYVLGMAVKMFAIAGPVLVFGTASSVVYGLILYIFQLV